MWNFGSVLNRVGNLMKTVDFGTLREVKNICLGVETASKSCLTEKNQTEIKTFISKSISKDVEGLSTILVKSARPMTRRTESTLVRYNHQFHVLGGG